MNGPDDPSPAPSAEAMRVATPDPALPEPVAVEPEATRWFLPLGLVVLTGCLLAGQWLKARCGLVLPGSIVGLFLLLGLLVAGVVPLRWVEAAARLLLWLLPFLFIPMFILAMRDPKFWTVQGRAVLGPTVLGTVLLWGVVGWLAERMLGKAEGRLESATARAATTQKVEGRGEEER